MWMEQTSTTESKPTSVGAGPPSQEADGTEEATSLAAQVCRGQPQVYFKRGQKESYLTSYVGVQSAPDLVLRALNHKAQEAEAEGGKP